LELRNVAEAEGSVVMELPLPGREEFDDIFSRLDTTHECDERTDERISADSKYHTTHRVAW